MYRTRDQSREERGFNGWMHSFLSPRRWFPLDRLFIHSFIRWSAGQTGGRGVILGRRLFGNGKIQIPSTFTTYGEPPSSFRHFFGWIQFIINVEEDNAHKLIQTVIGWLQYQNNNNVIRNVSRYFLFFTKWHIVTLQAICQRYLVFFGVRRFSDDDGRRVSSDCSVVVRWRRFLTKIRHSNDGWSNDTFQVSLARVVMWRNQEQPFHGFVKTWTKAPRTQTSTIFLGTASLWIW